MKNQLQSNYASPLSPRLQPKLLISLRNSRLSGDLWHWWSPVNRYLFIGMFVLQLSCQWLYLNFHHPLECQSLHPSLFCPGNSSFKAGFFSHSQKSSPGRGSGHILAQSHLWVLSWSEGMELINSCPIPLLDKIDFITYLPNPMFRWGQARQFLPNPFTGWGSTHQFLPNPIAAQGGLM